MQRLPGQEEVEKWFDAQENKSPSSPSYPPPPFLPIPCSLLYQAIRWAQNGINNLDLA